MQTVQNIGNLARMHEIGEMLFSSLLKDSYASGGRLAIFAGNQGCGKTSLLLKLSLAKMYNNNLVIWRGRDIVQFNRLDGWEEVTKVFVYYKDDIKFYDVSDGVAEEVKIKTHSYKNAKDLIRQLEYGKINVVYEPLEYKFHKKVIKELLRKVDFNLEEHGFKLNEERKSAYFWHELMWVLVNRLSAQFVTLSLDEADEIFPQDATGFQWYLHEWTANIVRDLRKTDTNVFLSSHDLAEIDWRIRRKFQVFGYMKGAKVLADHKLVKRYEKYLNKVGKILLLEGGMFGWAYSRPLPVKGMIKAVREKKKRAKKRLTQSGY